MEISERDGAELITTDLVGGSNQLTPLSLNKLSDHLYLTNDLTAREIVLFLLVHHDIRTHDNSSIITR